MKDSQVIEEILNTLKINGEEERKEMLKQIIEEVKVAYYMNGYNQASRERHKIKKEQLGLIAQSKNVVVLKKKN